MQVVAKVIAVTRSLCEHSEDWAAGSFHLLFMASNKRFLQAEATAPTSLRQLLVPPCNRPTDGAHISVEGVAMATNTISNIHKERFQCRI